MSLSRLSNTLNSAALSWIVVRDVIAGLQVDERGRIRLDAAVLDQRRLAEVPQARAAEPAARMIDREPDGRDVLDRAGMRSPAGSISLNRERDHARSASRISHETGFQIAPASMPRRSLSRLASVMPASPTNSSSES